MNRVGQILLVLGIVFMGIPVLHSVRRGHVGRPQMYQFVGSGLAAVTGALLLKKKAR